MHYVILHGSFGSPEENWFRWLEKELLNQGHSVTLDQYPVEDWDAFTSKGRARANAENCVQTLETWEAAFVTKTLPKIQSKSTVVIGHSLAPLFMLHMITKYDLKLKGLIAVSPFFTIPEDPKLWQFWAVNKTFYKTNFDYHKLKSLVSDVHVVYGDDDPYVPQKEVLNFARALAAKTHVVPGGGHCGSIFKQFPLILNIANYLA